jgi:tRNA pseudouridine38-40 synthase
MPRYRLTIEYEGALYAGWQRQPDARSVQGAIEAAITAFSGERAMARGAGRTDAGVHARGQVAHVDLARDWPTDTVRDALNAHLRKARETIAILDCAGVDERFDARLSATRRHYLYRIIDRRPPLALDRARAWHVPVRLDEAAMNAAAASILGRHDFTTFRAAECQAKSPVRTLERLHAVRNGEEFEIEASARSFLHHQVRSLVGSLVEIGRGKWPVSDLRRRLEARDRAQCGPTAPALGLYFLRVEYGTPDMVGLPPEEDETGERQDRQQHGG